MIMLPVHSRGTFWVVWCVLYAPRCELCGLTTERFHDDDDRYQRGNIDQRMRLTAFIPDIDQSSPHHELSGGFISADGGVLTQR